MKKIYFFLLAMFIGFGAVAQTVLYEDDFEAYTVGGFMAVQNPTWWTTWSGTPGSTEDATISDDFAHSPTKSVLVQNVTDLVLKLGNKTAGQFELTWWMYVQTGFAGYYNIQHFESPGIEWAFEIYFNEDGTCDLDVGGSTISGTYPKDTWFEVKHLIDIDADNIQLYINGTLFHEWPFSYQSTGTTGTDQLGGVDFFAGASTGETPKYYFDDVYYAQTGGGGDPEITVTPAELTNWVIAGGTKTDLLTVENTGESDLNWNQNIIYDFDGIKTVPAIEPGFQYPVKNAITNISVEHTPMPSGAPPNDATAVLHYDNDNIDNAIGWNTPPVTVTVAARFPCAMVNPYVGMEIVAVELYVRDLNASGSNEMFIKIYGMGNDFEPGTLLHEQSFTPPSYSWTTVNLTSPILVTGEDLWVGYQFTQTDPSIYIPGCDDGTNYTPNGDYLSTGVGWTHLGSNPALMYNWHVRAHLEGDPVPQWLSATPTSGTLPPLGSTDLDIGYDATELAPGIYNAHIRFLSNDPVTPSLDVPVELTVAGVGMNEPDMTTVTISPNPAHNFLKVVTTDPIESVKIRGLSGNTLYTGSQNMIDISALPNGVYFLQVVTSKGTTNQKFIKK